MPGWLWVVIVIAALILIGGFVLRYVVLMSIQA